MNHHLRACDTYASARGMMKAEGNILGCFEDVLGNCMSEAQRVQAALPLGVGVKACDVPVLSDQPQGRRPSLPSMRTEGKGWVVTQECLGATFAPLGRL